METINLVEYIPNTVILISILIAAACYWVIFPIMHFYRCHKSVVKCQQLGGIPKAQQWSLTKCLKIKIKSLTIDKIYKPSKHKRQTTFKARVALNITTGKEWVSEWIRALKSYSPKTQLKTIIELEQRVDEASKEYYRYYNKYNTLTSDCTDIVTYLNENIMEDDTTFDLLVTKATTFVKEKNAKEREESKEFDAALGNQSKDYKSSFV